MVRFGRVWEEMGRDRVVGRSPEVLVEAGSGETVVVGGLEVAMSGGARQAARLALIPRRRDSFVYVNNKPRITSVYIGERGRGKTLTLTEPVPYEIQFNRK